MAEVALGRLLEGTVVDTSAGGAPPMIKESLLAAGASWGVDAAKSRTSASSLTYGLTRNGSNRTFQDPQPPQANIVRLLEISP